MLRSMVFMDHMNFDIGLQNYYKSLGKWTPKLSYQQMFNDISASKEADHMKAFIFAPEPDAFLMKDPLLEQNYQWLQGHASQRYIDVIWGRYVARPTKSGIPMDINNRDTYYKVEKGTDINLAIHALSKAHYNSYDMAIFMSGDTDYINVYRMLKTIGKMVVVVSVEGQFISNKIKAEIDEYVYLKESDFAKWTRSPK